MVLPVSLVGRDVLFVHWPVDPAAVAPLVPDPLSVDTYDGSAWVSALALEVAGVARGGRSVPLPPSPQVLFRTYASREADRREASEGRAGGTRGRAAHETSGERNDSRADRHASREARPEGAPRREHGVVFWACDTPGALGRVFGQRLFSLPINRARVEFRRRGDTVTVRSRRRADGTRFDARYRPTGEAVPADEGSLEAFLLERHAYFGDGTVGRVERDPWLLAPAEVEVRTNTLFEAVDLDAPTADPVVGYCPRFEPRFLGTEPL